MRLVTFQLGDATYAIDAASVIEILRPLPITPVPRAPETIAGLVNLRGQIIVAVDLARRLGLARERGQMNVLVRSALGPTSLLVDRIGDVIDGDSAAFSAPPATLPWALRGLTASCCALPDRLVLVLDADRICALQDDGGLS